MTASPTLSLVVTVGAYLLGVFLSRRSRSPIFHPVVVGVVGVSLYLSLTRLPYAAYAGQTGMLSYLLGPAIVALALPLYEQSAALRRNLRPLVGASVFCVVLIAGLGFAIGCGLSLSPDFRLALMTRASSAIGMAIAEGAGRSPAVAAVVAILGGMAGGALGPWVLDRFGVREPGARGVALGAIASGIGTARAMEEGEEGGSAAVVGMCLAGIVTALLIPVLWGWLAQ